MADNPSVMAAQPSAAQDALCLGFLHALAASRDHLYVLALARTSSPAAAEATLLQMARSLFRQAATDPHLDILSCLVRSLSPPAVTDVSVSTAMPADVWARLAAAIHVEAASSADSRALHSGSVLREVDPLLAPKKTKPRTREPDVFDVSTPRRLLTFIGAVFLMGIVITLVIVTRQASLKSSATHPAGVP